MNVALSILFQWIPWMVPTAGGLYFISRYVKAIETRNAVRDELDTLQEQVLQLEERLTVCTNGLQQIAETQDFAKQLLKGRTDQSIE